MRFEWDSEKAASNLKKHRVSFDEAVTVFFHDTFPVVEVAARFALLWAFALVWCVDGWRRWRR